MLQDRFILPVCRALCIDKRDFEDGKMALRLWFWMRAV